MQDLIKRGSDNFSIMSNTALSSNWEDSNYNFDNSTGQ